MTTRTRNRWFALCAALLLLACENNSARLSGPQGVTTFAGETIAIISGDGQEGAPGAVLPAPLVIEVRDNRNRTARNITGTWTVEGGGAVSSPTFNTNSQGRAQVNWTLGLEGTQTVTATITGGPPVVFTASFASVRTIEIVSGNNQATTAGGTLPEKPTIIVKNENGDPVPGATGSWSITAGGGSLSAPAFTTDGNGRAEVDWTLGTSGAQTMSATIGGSFATFSAKIVTIAISAGDNQNGTPGATLPIKPRITVRELGTNLPVAGVNGAWAVTAGGGSVSSAGFTTDANGLAEVSWTLGSAGPQVLTAIVAGGGSVAFNASFVGISIVAGDNQTGTSGNALPINPMILVANSLGVPIAGASGTWAVTSGGGSVSSTVFTTGADGTAQVQWTLGSGDTQQLTASLAGGAGSVTFNASLLAFSALSIVSGNNQIGIGGQTLPSALIIQVRDEFGSNVRNAAGTFTVTSGGGSVSSGTFKTNTGGRASVTWTLGPSGPQTVTATLTSTGESIVFDATVIPVGSRLSIVNGNAQVGTPRDTLPISATIELRDPDNNRLSGVMTEWSVEPGSALGGVRFATRSTNLNGRASNFWVLGWAKQEQTLKVRVPGIDSIFFTASIDVGRINFEIVSGNNQSGGPGSVLPQRLVISVTDSDGFAFSGVPGTFAVNSGGGSINKTALLTGATGRDSVTWTLGTSGPQSVVATIPALGVTQTFNATVAVVPPPPGSKLTIVAGNNQKGTGKDTLAVLPTVELRDPSNNLIVGANIQWSVEAGNNLGGVRSATTTTGANGRASNAWLLGWGKNQQTLKAKLAGIDSITFTASIDTARLRWRIVSGNNQVGPAGTPLTNKLVVELKDTAGNAFSGVPASFAVTSGGGSLSKTAISLGATGRDSAVWTLGPSGTQTVTALQPALGTLTFTATFGSTAPVAGTCATGPKTIVLDLPLGQTQRFRATDANAPSCLDFNRTRDLGRQYLVLFEDVPPVGYYNSGYFAGTHNTQVFGYVISTAPPPAGSVIVPPMIAQSLVTANENEPLHAWDSPSGPLYEIPPHMVSGNAPPAGRMNPNMSVNAIITYNVGDTLSVFMAGIPRLAIPDGNQKVVVRKVTNNLVFAEDVRLGTLVREDGVSKNTPWTDAQMTAIAAEYDAYGHVQNNLLFNNTWNATTINAGLKVVVAHSIMPSNSTWGYTPAHSNVLVFDYWVSTKDGKTAGTNQHPQKVADNLITHEIAHQRHYALLPATFTSYPIGLQWVEGFARWTERGATANRLLGTVNYSRTNNLTLPKNPAFGTATFMNDIPDYTKSATGIFTGYDAFAYFFDYFSDQYALTGGDWRAGVRNLIANSSNETALNNAINSMLPGNTVFGMLTKARVALYADDYPNVVLPSSTQFTQYNLRLSRSSSADPRTLFPKIVPGGTYTKSASLSPGTAAGFLIDGSAATNNAAINITLQPYARGAVSVTRIR